jgi:TRAP-type C4-dicarboxylate transport system permease small subunit
MTTDHPIQRIAKFASNALIGVAATGLIAMVAIVGWQVLGRYVLGSSPSWTEQAAQVLMIWFSFLAAAAGIREGFHIRIVALEETASPRVRRMIQRTASLIVAGCGIAMAVYGADLVIRTWSHVIPSLGLPRGFAYLGLPISGGLIVLFEVERMLFPHKDPEPQVGTE